MPCVRNRKPSVPPECQPSGEAVSANSHNVAAGLLVVFQVLAGHAVEHQDDELPENTDRGSNYGRVVGRGVNADLERIPDRAEERLKPLPLPFRFAAKVPPVRVWQSAMRS